MELDEYKIVIRQKPLIAFHRKAIPELENHMRQQTGSLMHIIKKNLKLEILFALLFLIFDGYMIFIADGYLRVLAILLAAFCIYFIYYLAKLLQFIQIQHDLITSVKHLLENYIHIIRRFTRLYFQLTMAIIPFLFFLAFIAVYLNYRVQPFSINDPFVFENLWLYAGISILWLCMMYFFTRWYIKKLYGSHLNKLKEQLRELQDGE